MRIGRGPDCPLRDVVVTETFDCGIDIPDIQHVIIFGAPYNLDSVYQQLGRATRGLLLGGGWIYVSPKF